MRFVIAGRGQAVEVRRGWITKKLLRNGSRVPLHPVWFSSGIKKTVLIWLGTKAACAVVIPKALARNAAASAKFFKRKSFVDFRSLILEWLSAA